MHAAIIAGLRGPKTEQHPEGEPWVEESFFFAGSPVALFVTLSEAGSEEPRDAFTAIRKAASDSQVRTCPRLL